jgi:phage-related protein
LSNYSVEAELKANVTKFRNAIQKAREITKRFKKDSESAEDTTLKADIKPLKRNIKKAKKMMERFTRKKAEKEVDADIVSFYKKINNLQAKAKALVRNKIIVRVEARVDKFQSRIDRIAKTMSSVGIVVGNAFRGGLLSVLPAIVPFIASLAGGVGGLATSFAAAGTGAVLFGSVATSALNDVFEANKNIKDLRKELANTTDLEKRAEILKEIEQAQASLSTEQQRGLKAVQSFSKFWSKFAKQFEKPVMDIFIRSLDQLQSLIKDLKPAFDGAISAADTLSKSLGLSMESQDFKDFISFLNNNAGPAMTSLGKSFGNVMQGIMNLMVAFTPLSQDMQGGLVGLTERFAAWSAKLDETKGFQNFIKYVKENGPKVMALIGNLTDFLIQLGIGMAPLGSKILDVVNGFLSWSSEMMKSYPLIGQLIGWALSLTGVLIAMVPAVILLKTAFGGFVGKMIGWLLKLSTRALMWAARMALSWVIAMGPIGWAIAAVVGLVVLVIANWDKVKKWTVKIWSAVWGWIKDIASKIKNWVSDKFNALTNVVDEKMSSAWNIIKDIWNNILNFFESIDLYESGKAIIQSAIDGLSAMKGKILGVVDNIVGAVRDFWPFSPAKRGPLSDIHRMDFKGPIRTSIEKAKSPLVRATAKLASGVRTAFNPDLSVNTSQIRSSLKGLKRSSTAQVNSSVNADVQVTTKKPAIINVTLGRESFKAFVDDITEEQERELRIDESFR